MFKAAMGVIGGIFSAGAVTGIILGLEIVWSLHYFVTLKFGIFKFKKSNIIPWCDISISSVLLSVAFTHPSLAIPLSFAGLVVRVYLRLVAHNNDPTYWLWRIFTCVSKTATSIGHYIYDATNTFINDVKVAAKEE